MQLESTEAVISFSLSAHASVDMTVQDQMVELPFKELNPLLNH